MTSKAKVWRPEGLQGVECLRASHQGVSFSRHFHTGYALGVVLGGALGFRYLGKDCLAQTGSVNLVVPGEVHDGRQASPAGWAYRMFYLDVDAVEGVAAELSEGVSTQPAFPGGVIDDPDLARRIAWLHRDLECGCCTLLERQSRLTGILATWISRHSGSRRDLKASSEPGAVARAREYLRSRVAEPVALAELALACGLSPCRLNRVFSKAVGLAPHAYQVLMRVEKARGCLRDGMSPAEAAITTGFSDQSHLNRHFKRITGITPGLYGKIVQDH